MKHYAVIGAISEKAYLFNHGELKEVNLSWIEGQVGAMPVFDDKVLAHQFARKVNGSVVEFSKNHQTIPDGVKKW